MNSNWRAYLATAIMLLGMLGVGGYWWSSRSAAQRVATQSQSGQGQPNPAQGPARPFFLQEELAPFLAATQKAEAIADPLQRCLAYPDPPNSHWSHDAVAAYCHYRFQSFLSFKEVQALIQGGHAAELDRRLAQALNEQQTKPDSVGLLDLIYYADFDSGLPEVRSMIEAWKRASPKSAFAYAASGFAYVDAAADARGTAFMQDTPKSKVEAMERFLSRANDDLQHAIALDPQVTPAYVAMINLGKMGAGGEGDYAGQAFQLGVTAAPADYAIYNSYMTALQPKWGGSLSSMQQLASMAQAHAKENPLLKLLPAEVLAYRYDVCNCESRANWAMVSSAFDEAADAELLMNAGSAASVNGYNELAAVYLSEALRFEPNAGKAHVYRDNALTVLGQPAWALADANWMVSVSPNYGEAYDARAYAYEAQGDYTHAAQDLSKAITLDNDDTWAVAELGKIYVDKTHEWDYGWDIADRLIRFHPEDPRGWALRAGIQEHQPRAGLDDTIQYFLGHFGGDPSQSSLVMHLRALQAQGATSRTAAAASASTPHG